MTAGAMDPNTTVSLDKAFSLSDFGNVGLPSFLDGASGDLSLLLPSLDEQLKGFNSGMLDGLIGNKFSQQALADTGDKSAKGAHYLCDTNLHAMADDSSASPSEESAVTGSSRLPSVRSGTASQAQALGRGVRPASSEPGWHIAHPTAFAAAASGLLASVQEQPGPPERTNDQVVPKQQAWSEEWSAFAAAALPTSEDTSDGTAEEEDLEAEDADTQEDPEQGFHSTKAKGSRRMSTRAASLMRAAPAGAGRAADVLARKEKKKVGRPIAYKGDPNAAHLTEEERRRIKRRVANRESARRVRQKRLEVMDDMQVKLQAVAEQNTQLVAHIHQVEASRQGVIRQLKALHDSWQAESRKKDSLQCEVTALQHSLQVALHGKEAREQANMAMGLDAASEMMPGSSTDVFAELPCGAKLLESWPLACSAPASFAPDLS